MKCFSSIEQFRHIVERVHHWAQATSSELPTLTFQGTAKLHGTNTGISRIVQGDGSIVYGAQSRKQKLSTEEQHFGFLTFLRQIPEEALESLFATARQNLATKESDETMTIFGELIGKGVQKGVAVSKLPEKQFVVFQVALGSEYVGNHVDIALPEHKVHNILSVSPYTVEVSFSAPEEAVRQMEKLTLAVEKKCPWGAKFGIDGVGEGIVWTCMERPADSALWFKTKGHKHSEKVKRKTIEISPEKMASIEECAEKVMTEARLAKGLDHLKEQGLAIEARNTGAFLAYIGKELEREERDTIEVSQIEWKSLWKVAAKMARQYFLKETQRLP